MLHVQIGLSENSMMKDYHKDALDRYNVTCDFPRVIRELVDPHKRFPFQVSCQCSAFNSPLTLDSSRLEVSYLCCVRIH